MNETSKENKKILFDLTRTQQIGTIKFHGGGKYGIAVFKKLMQMQPQSIVAYYNDSLELDSEIIDLLKEKAITVYRTSEIDILQVIHKTRNIVYSPLFREEYCTNSDVQAIVTIHGLRILEMPDDKYEKYYLDKGTAKPTLLKIVKDFLSGLQIVKNYKHKKYLEQNRSLFKHENLSFVTVSEHSKSSILAFMPFLKEENIKVFYSPSTINDNIDISQYKNPYGKYFLIVSGNRWLKNGIRAIMALDQLFTDRPELRGKVVVTGLKKAGDIVIRIVNLERFVFTGYVDETTLKGLYHHAHVLIYPSLNEGFGYPPLEAMHESCPVIASAIASIPEVCGESILYFNPYSIPEIKMRILQMENKSVRDEYARRGKERQGLIEKKQEVDLEKLCRYILSFVK